MARSPYPRSPRSQQTAERKHMIARHAFNLFMSEERKHSPVIGEDVGTTVAMDLIRGNYANIGHHNGKTYLTQRIDTCKNVQKQAYLTDRFGKEVISRIPYHGGPAIRAEPDHWPVRA